MIKVAIWGAGAIGNLWAEQLQRSPLATLVAVGSHNRSKAQALARSSQAQVASSLDALLALDVDLLFICTLPASHYAEAKQAIAAGKDVFVEKPLCLELAQASELRALASAKGVWLAVSHSLRYFSPFATLLTLAERGELGKVKHLAWQRSEDLSLGWRAQHSLSGGYWFEIGWHELDISLQLLSLCGHDLSELQCHYSAWQLDQQSMFCQEREQMLISYLASRVGPARFGFRLQFEHLTLCSEQGFSRHGLRTLHAEPELTSAFQPWQHDPYAAQLQHVLTAWQQRHPPTSVGQSLSLIDLLQQLPS